MAAARHLRRGKDFHPVKTGDLARTDVRQIYNEQLHDLLVPDSVPQSERPNVTIREDTKGRILLTGLKQVPINSVDDLMNALHFGSTIRQTDSTAINSKSSRSHAVFSLNLVQKRLRSPPATAAEKRMTLPAEPLSWDDAVTIDSKLHFVDLAGSERLKNSGLTGERVKEGISINAGLASLGKVISQLSSRASGSHVSYRDSRLTRMLQDSLGGNAITYMVACINPVEFHLSETLNTVQYAQRARAIQSRPQIQQRTDDGDKQLIIDRLRAEVKFLREQIRSSQSSDRRKTSSHDRTVRNMERENELQNQLLDIQENYSALSHRHAKLISELAKGNSADTEVLPLRLKGALEYTARDRLNRHSTFAEQVEQVILEYEKTIQSLESSLSNTRSSLSTSESNLLEREAKIVYMEALTQQLQSRYSKAMDREANGETYVQELEAKLDSVTTGEEKQMIVIQDLRKELSRVRESEISAEEYISTLEERLAEAEQDTEVMQREISRLEHVIERQRSIGKLDNLLSELDHLGDGITPTNGAAQSPYHNNDPTDMFHDRLVATASAHHPHGELAPESAEEEWKSFGPMEGDDDDSHSQYTSRSFEQARGGLSESRPSAVAKSGADEKVHSPAQARVIADKLETLTMELFELRGEHQSTVTELDDVSRKYQIALSTLAELQDAVAGNRQTQRTSFLERGAMSDPREDGHRSSSRMLSSELSSRGDSPTLVEASDAGTPFSENGDSRHLSRVMQKDETLAGSIRALKRANAEKDINITELTENYSQLEDQHRDTLKYIEELKEEMQKLQSSSSSSTLLQPAALTRRRSHQNINREGRVFASLQNLAVEHLSGKPEAVKSFEANLGAAMTEAQLRQDRVEALEAELASAKKELGVKNTMISGLHRERASRSAAPTDVGYVLAVKDQLAQTRQYLSSVQEKNKAHHEDIVGGIRSFSQHLMAHDETVENGVVEAPAEDVKEESKSKEVEDEATSGIRAANVAAKRVSLSDLPAQLASWDTKNKATFEAVQILEAELVRALSGLEVSLQNAETLHAEKLNARGLRADINRGDAHGELVAAMEDKDNAWTQKTAALHAKIASLEEEVTSHKARARDHAEKVQNLETSFNQIIQETQQKSKSRETKDNELRTHRELIASLEDQVDQHKSLAIFHQQSLKTMEESHARELEEVKATLAQPRDGDATALSELQSKHDESISALQQELTTAHMETAEILQSVSAALQEEADPSNLQSRIQALADERKSLSTKHTAASAALAEAQAEAAEAKDISLQLQSKVDELTMLNDETMRELEKSVEKEQKSTRLVQELEEQLTSNFDQHKTANQRLSSAQKERVEVEKELEEYRGKVSTLEVSGTNLSCVLGLITDASIQTQLLEMKRMTAASYHSPRESTFEESRPLSSSSHLRKSASQASFPASPPPAVPLPPLPTQRKDREAATGSPPPSRHSSKDIVALQEEHTRQLNELATQVKSLDKKLNTEKQLTQTLEQALIDLESLNNKTTADAESWKRKCREIEEEASGLRNERGRMRNSIQMLQDETMRRKTAEEARKRLEEQMGLLSAGDRGKKKKNALNCF